MRPDVRQDDWERGAALAHFQGPMCQHLSALV